MIVPHYLCKLQTWISLQVRYWLVVSAHNISQNGNLPHLGMKIKNIWNHHPGYVSITFCKETSRSPFTTTPACPPQHSLNRSSKVVIPNRGKSGWKETEVKSCPRETPKSMEKAKQLWAPIMAEVTEASQICEENIHSQQKHLKIDSRKKANWNSERNFNLEQSTNHGYSGPFAVSFREGLKYITYIHIIVLSLYIPKCWWWYHPTNHIKKPLENQLQDWTTIFHPTWKKLEEALIKLMIQKLPSYLHIQHYFFGGEDFPLLLLVTKTSSTFSTHPNFRLCIW